MWGGLTEHTLLLNVFMWGVLYKHPPASTQKGGTPGSFSWAILKSGKKIKRILFL